MVALIAERPCTCLQALLGDAKGLALIQQSSLLLHDFPVLLQLVVLNAAVVLHPKQGQQAEDDGYSHRYQRHSSLRIAWDKAY